MSRALSKSFPVYSNIRKKWDTKLEKPKLRSFVTCCSKLKLRPSVTFAFGLWSEISNVRFETKY